MSCVSIGHSIRYMHNTLYIYILLLYCCKTHTHNIQCMQIITYYVYIDMYREYAVYIWHIVYIYVHIKSQGVCVRVGQGGRRGGAPPRNNARL